MECRTFVRILSMYLSLLFISIAIVCTLMPWPWHMLDVSISAIPGYEYGMMFWPWILLSINDWCVWVICCPVKNKCKYFSLNSVSIPGEKSWQQQIGSNLGKCWKLFYMNIKQKTKELQIAPEIYIFTLPVVFNLMTWTWIIVILDFKAVAHRLLLSYFLRSTSLIILFRLFL